MELTPVRVLVAGSDGYIGQVLAPIHQIAALAFAAPLVRALGETVCVRAAGLGIWLSVPLRMELPCLRGGAEAMRQENLF